MLRGWLGDADLHVITGAGHWPQWEKPAEFVAVHREFLADRHVPGAQA